MLSQVEPQPDEVSPYLRAYIKHRASRASVGPDTGRKSRISIASLMAFPASRTSGAARRSTLLQQKAQQGHKHSPDAAGSLDTLVRMKQQVVR